MPRELIGGDFKLSGVGLGRKNPGKSKRLVPLHGKETNDVCEGGGQ